MRIFDRDTLRHGWKLDTESSARFEGELLWLVRLRWAACVGISVAALGAQAMGFIESALPLLGVAAVMVAYNTAFHVWNRRHERRITGLSFQRAVLTQLTADLVTLVYALHLAGGIENPFASFLVFHMAIGAILLGRTAAWLGAVVATTSFGAICLAELVGVIHHHQLHIYFADTGVVEPFELPAYVGGHLFALFLTFAGAIYFVRAITVRHRAAEAQLREHERVALVRERMARIGEISAGVAHAIRNPLHGLLNCVDILQSRGVPAQSAEILSLMQEGMVRIQHVTERLLTLGTEAPLQRTPAPLGEIILQVTRLVQLRAEPHGVAIETQLQTCPDVEMDTERVGEALMNIVDNALHACEPSGRVEVRLFAAGVPPRAIVEIEDNGCGIPADALPKVFDAFFTSKAIGEGTGLGLAISRRIVEEHGGTITVDSQQGVGTTVRVSLPVADDTTLSEVP